MARITGFQPVEEGSEPSWGIMKETKILVEVNPYKLLVDRTISYLEYDRSHPDVGMGMLYSTAIEYALNDIKNDFNVDLTSYSTDQYFLQMFKNERKSRKL